MSRAFRFKPRFAALAYGAVGVGAALLGAVVVFGLDGDNRTFALIVGLGAVALGALYLLSPAWRYQVLVDDDGLEVQTGRGERRFRVAWTDARKVIASPDTKTLVFFGDGPEHNLIVPGPGAPAPYDIEDKPALYDAIVTNVPAALVQEVDLLENVDAAAAAPEPPAPTTGDDPPTA